jgi:phosphoheptose isomerase
MTNLLERNRRPFAAIGNDDAISEVFSRQREALGRPEEAPAAGFVTARVQKAHKEAHKFLLHTICDPADEWLRPRV